MSRHKNILQHILCKIIYSYWNIFHSTFSSMSNETAVLPLTRPKFESLTIGIWKIVESDWKMHLIDYYNVPYYKFNIHHYVTVFFLFDGVIEYWYIKKKLSQNEKFFLADTFIFSVYFPSKDNI